MTLTALTIRQDILIVNCNKNLGPAVIDTNTYILRAFQDRLITPSYREYSDIEATAHMKTVAIKIKQWLHKHK